MGFAVDHELVTLTADPGVYDDAARLAGSYQFEDFARVLAEPGPWRDYAHSIAALWRDLMTPIGSAEDTVLFIGHSGEIEAALIACFPHADYATWGRQFGPCEGARLTFGGTEPECWRHVEMVRT
jgi:hypothetical protein